MLLDALSGMVEYLEWSSAFWRFIFQPAYRSELGREWRGGNLADRIGMVVGGLLCTAVGLIPLWIVLVLLVTE